MKFKSVNDSSTPNSELYNPSLILSDYVMASSTLGQILSTSTSTGPTDSIGWKASIFTIPIPGNSTSTNVSLSFEFIQHYELVQKLAIDATSGVGASMIADAKKSMSSSGQALDTILKIADAVPAGRIIDAVVMNRVPGSKMISEKAYRAMQGFVQT
jgi:hypothetical protein